MIEPTEADIGRRVAYDVKKELGYIAHGTLVGLTGGPFGNWIQVLFDGYSGPLNVGSHLKWAEDVARPAKRRASGATEGSAPLATDEPNLLPTPPKAEAE